MCPWSVKTVKLDRLASESPSSSSMFLPFLTGLGILQEQPSHVLCVCYPRNDPKGHLWQFLSQETVEGADKAGMFAKVSNFFFP